MTVNFFSRGFNFQAMLKTNDITKDVQNHLVLVYSTLSATILAATVGVCLDLYLHFGGSVSMLGSIGLFMLLASAPKYDTKRRFGYLMGIGFCNGLSIGSLIELILHVDPSILITAFLSTVVVFICFTGSALLAKRRSYLYLGGILSSALSCMLVLSLMNMFFKNIALFNTQLYMGLLVFCGYILFDTQMIIEKTIYGDRDFIQHAGELFMDVLSVFVRICVILVKNASQKNKKNSR